MQVTYADPYTMPFHLVADELVSLRKTSSEDKAKIQVMEKRNETQDIQIDALRKTNVLTIAMLSNVNATLPPAKATWLKQNINVLTQKIKDLICDITSASRSSMVSVYTALYNAAIDICNFIHDHFAQIAVGAVLALGAAVILFDIIVLGSAVSKGLLPASEALAQGAGNMIDLTHINDFI